MKPQEQVAEVFYQHALELTKTAYYAINRAYPPEERKANPKVEYRYQEALRQAKQHLNHFKTIVRDVILPLTIIKVHPRDYEDPQDQTTSELRLLIINQLSYLQLRLTDHAELLVPADDVDSFLKSLAKRFETEYASLIADLKKYEATAKYPTEESFTSR